MGSRFAGAQDQADRRRRWLANDDLANDNQGEKSFTDASYGSPIDAFAETAAVPHSPELEFVRYLISPMLWKHIVALTAVLLLGIGVAYWSHSLAAETRFGNTAVSPMRLLDGFSGILMLLSGQLAIVTGWLRSRSEVDFQGRYRGWKWMAAASCLLATIILTGTSDIVTTLMTSFIEFFTGPIQSARPAILFIGCVSSAMLILGRVLPDMGRCVYTQGLLVVAVLATIVRLMLMYGAAQVEINSSVFNQLTLLATFATFGSMLLHCRYVAFICNDPPRQFIVQPEADLPETANTPEVTTTIEAVETVAATVEVAVVTAADAVQDDTTDKAAASSKNASRKSAKKKRTPDGKPSKAA